MHRARFILSVLSLMLGASIVFVSLSAVSPVLSSETPATHKRFYMEDPILPDHVAYPLVMIADRITLETAPASDKIELELEYGLRRLDYARQLLDKGDTDLALTTLTKSEKYIIQAAQTALDTQASAETKEKVLKVLIRYLQETTQLTDRFSDADRVTVDQLLKESEALQLQLRESLALS